MFPIPPSEHLIETKSCRHCQTSFPITDTDLEFYEKVSPTFGGKKYQIPSPTLCPDCRQQRRLSFRNERKLYKRKCDATGKDIISIYSPDKGVTVYHQDYWWSDKWDPMDSGREFDFSRSAMEQMGELMRETPRASVLQKMSENSEYNSSIGYCKDCYLVSDSDVVENSYFSAIIKNSKNIVDGLHIYNCETIYNSINCTDSSFLFHCFECDNSHHLIGCSRMSGCEYCFESSNAVNKKFLIRNVQVTEQEYTSFLKNAPHGQLSDFWIARNLYLIQSENVIGNNVYQSRNILSGYNLGKCDNVRYSTLLNDTKDAMDVDAFGGNLSRSYESISIGDGSDMILFWDVITTQCQRIFYSYFLVGCQNCFLCSGLRNASYCILNKQYAKEEYEILVPKIIEKMITDGEWWEFFPSTLSPFGYNETVANEYFPLAKSEATKDGRFNWSDYEAPFPQVAKIIPASKLPENIEDIPDDILNWAIECEVTKKPFRIIRQELDFYRKHNLPIPKRHPDQRHLDRMALRNPRKLYERKCDKCQKDMITTYAPERPEIVHCEACYQKEVLG